MHFSQMRPATIRRMSGALVRLVFHGLIDSFYLIASFLFSRQGVVAPTAGNLRFWTGLLFLSRASVDSDADWHTTVGSLWVEHRSAGVGSIGIVPIGHVAY